MTPAEIARSLTEAEAAMLGLDRVDGIADGLRNAWHLEELGLIEREAFVFGFFYQPTPLGLQVRAELAKER